MYAKLFATFGLLAASACAAPAPSTHVLHEKRESPTTRWIKGDRFGSDVVVPVRIGMTQSNLEKGHDHLMDISNPESENYGKHWSVEDVHDLFAPSSKSVEAVRGWLETAGIEAKRISQSVNKQWMQFDATVAELEDLVKAKYHHFEHSTLDKTSVACDESVVSQHLKCANASANSSNRYHVPADIRHHIDYIVPGIKHMETNAGRKGLAKRKAGRRSSSLPPILAPLPGLLSDLLTLGGAICDTAIVPNCISRLYNITAGTKHAAGNELGIFEDLGDVYSQTDLNLFFATLAPQIPQGTHPKLDSIDGAVAPNPVTSAGAESDLDFQISYPIIYPQGSILFQTDDPVYEANYTFEGFLNNFLDAIDGAGGYKGQKQCGVYKPTNVVSISYGGAEFDLPASYQIRVRDPDPQASEKTLTCPSIAMPGVRDAGVSGSAGDDNPNGCLGPDANIFSPDSAAGANVNTDQEVATTRFPSGGGFSNIFTTPSYQSSAVNTYFKTAGTQYKYYNTSGSENPFPAANNGGIYNIAGRGYPDVSAVGDNVVIFNAGLPTLIGGTSASSPVWGAIMTRINEERIAVGKSTVGFINPTLYKNPSVLHDITVGNNPGCNTTGFAASKGWDPVTGLGTPNYPALLKLLPQGYFQAGTPWRRRVHLCIVPSDHVGKCLHHIHTVNNVDFRNTLSGVPSAIRAQIVLSGPAAAALYPREWIFLRRLLRNLGLAVDPSARAAHRPNRNVIFAKPPTAYHAWNSFPMWRYVDVRPRRKDRSSRMGPQPATPAEARFTNGWPARGDFDRRAGFHGSHGRRLSPPGSVIAGFPVNVPPRCSCHHTVDAKLAARTGEST
nr:tripeptidyl-peptidase sed1 [Quercus suber]